MSLLYTIGHSTRSEADFLGLLRSHGIELLVDVRRYAHSGRFPHFGAERLPAALAAAGIGYLHEPDLGGRRKPGPVSRNAWWKNEQFRGYADHVATGEFRGALERVLAAAAGRRVALMCSEAVPWRCHRHLIADVLVAHGHEVRHITASERADSHVLNPAARLLADGTLVWGDPPSNQQELFPG